MSKQSSRRITPISWISTLYMAEGFPYFAVNTLAVILYTRMGVGLKEMAFATGWLYLPWVIKPFWSPFVDIFSTKRRWILAMQAGITITFLGVALSLFSSLYFIFSIIVFGIMAFLSATHDIAADGYYMLALNHHEQAVYVGWRNTFYRISSVIGQGGLVMLAGYLETTAGIATAWSLTFSMLSLLFLAIFLYHTKILPRPAEDKPAEQTRNIGREFSQTFVTFFSKKHILTALAFILLYRFGEALMLKVATPFLLAPRSEGGLELSTAAVGFINGTVGVIALLSGGIAGGTAISYFGLKKCLWPMAMALTLPCGVYCWMAMTQPTSFMAVNACIAFEQFGYGFGFTAFMMYLILFCEGEFKTSHYAFCTGIMALGMMLPGMAAGWLYEVLACVDIFHVSRPGYVNYFWFVIACSLLTYAVCMLVHIPADFGKQRGCKQARKQ